MSRELDEIVFYQISYMFRAWIALEHVAYHMVELPGLDYNHLDRIIVHKHGAKWSFPNNNIKGQPPASEKCE